MKDLDYERDFVLDPSLQLYLPLWRKQGVSFMSDDKNGYLCTVYGATWTPQGYSFDGADDYISIPQAVSQSLTGAPGSTVIAWFKLNDLATNISLWLGNATGGTRVSLQYTATGNLYAGGRSGTEAVQGGSMSTVNPSVITFHAAVFNLSAQTITIYRNMASAIIGGLAFASATYQNSAYTANTIGRTGSDYINGTIGNVILYNRVLSDNELWRLYEATKWRYT